MTDFPIHPFPIIKADGYLLRQLLPADVNEIFALRADDRINEFLDRPKANSLNDAHKFISRIIHGVQTGEYLYWAIVPGEGSPLIGTISYWNFSKVNSKAEIGYELLPSYHGRGIIQKILPAFLQFGFKDLGFKKIEAVIHTGNTRSIRIMEKFDFNRDHSGEKKMNPPLQDHLVLYSMKG
jgi:[ribosomal protein S5]-alanine N-acetyltransferase